MPNRQLIFTIVLIFAAGFLGWLIIKDFPQKIETSRQLKDLKSRIEALEKDEERQKGLIEYLNTESYLEKQVRIRLNLKKEAEEVVFVYRKEEPEESQNRKNENENPFLAKIKEWLKILMPN